MHPSENYSEQQGAFVRGRLITDNFLLAHEALFAMKRRSKGQMGLAALKVDMSKAYDRVEWGFLEAVMRKMGFDPQWIKWIMMCVKSVTYYVLVQGRKVGPIIPSRGLRQWYPLSPYLFLFSAEALSYIISAYSTEGLIKGCKISKNAPQLTHLFFADDSIFFF